MIWGMTLQPGYEYTEIVDDEVRLSMATLECRPRKSQGDTFQLSSHVVLKTVRGEFLLCNLEKGPTPQQSLDLVLQPRERVTFSVEGTGVVHLMGYTSECPEEQQDQEDPVDNVTELPPAEHHPEPPHPQEMDEMVQLQPLEEENQDITVKSEPESVVIPILEEALEEMDQAAKDEEVTDPNEMIEEGLPGTTPIQASSSKDLSGALSSDNYGYQQISQEEGWISPEQPRVRGVPTDSVPSTETPPSFSGGPMRSMQGSMSSDMPSTSYTHVSQVPAGQSSRGPATRRPATSGSQGRLVSQTLAGGDTSEILSPVIADGTMLRKSRTRPKDKIYRQRDKRQCLPCQRTVVTVKGSYPFKCQFCGRLFRHKHSCLTHERRHTGEKPFSCRFCVKAFACSSDRTLHERLHTGEKPYKCGVCGKAYADRSNCKKHLVICTKKHAST